MFTKPRPFSLRMVKRVYSVEKVKASKKNKKYIITYILHIWTKVFKTVACVLYTTPSTEYIKGDEVFLREIKNFYIRISVVIIKAFLIYNIYIIYIMKLLLIL